MASLITLAEFIVYTQASFSVSAMKLDLASTTVQNYVGRTFGVRTITNEKKRSKITADQDLLIDFTVKPVSSVSAISLSWGQDVDMTSLDLTSLEIFHIEGYALMPLPEIRTCLARVTRANMGVGWLRVGDEYVTLSTYIGGEVVPDVIKHAIALIALEDHLVKAQWATGDLSGGIVKSYSVGSYSQSVGSPYTGSTKVPGTLGHGSPIGRSAELLLIESGYIKGGMVGIV